MGRGYGQDGRPGAPDPGHPPTDTMALAESVGAARHDPSKVVLEGVHALKHALRFGADVEVVATPDLAALSALIEEVAPDLAAEVRRRAVHLDAGAWDRAIGRTLPSPALSVAVRPQLGAAEVLASSGPVVLLEQPRHLGNLGAVIRVAAAADAGGVLVVGAADPWHPIAVRGAAGLQFALPVARCDALPSTDRPLIALDAQGVTLGPGVLPANAVIAVGTERGGLSDDLLGRADTRVSIPMRAGVSSLNLATAVAIALYAPGPRGS
jgi:RNA methyltransferase, TrmH family